MGAALCRPSLSCDSEADNRRSPYKHHSKIPRRVRRPSASPLLRRANSFSILTTRLPPCTTDPLYEITDQGLRPRFYGTLNSDLRPRGRSLDDLVGTQGGRRERYVERTTDPVSIHALQPSLHEKRGLVEDPLTLDARSSWDTGRSPIPDASRGSKTSFSPMVVEEIQYCPSGADIDSSEDFARTLAASGVGLACAAPRAPSDGSGGVCREMASSSSVTSGHSSPGSSFAPLILGQRRSRAMTRDRDNAVADRFRERFEDSGKRSSQSLREAVLLKRDRVGGKRQSIALPKRSHKEFIYMDILGRGSFGKVVRVRSVQSGENFAMKIIDKKAIKKDLANDFFLHIKDEKMMLNSFDHPFIVRLLFDFDTSRYLFLVMELVRGEALSTKLAREGRLPEDLVRFYAAEITLALGHMHDNEVVFRDLKLDNVILDHCGHVRLIDLGVARRLGPGAEPLTEVVGGSGFRPPEMLLGRPQSYTLDWWNLGVLLFKLLTKKHPFAPVLSLSLSISRLDVATLENTVSYPNFLSKDCVSFIDALLERDPSRRLGAGGSEEVKIHPWLRHVDFVELLKRRATPPHFERSAESQLSPLDPSEPAHFASVKDVMKEFNATDTTAIVMEMF